MSALSLFLLRRARACADVPNSSNDWCLNDNPGSACAQYGLQNQADLEKELRGWQSGPKSPGCLGLEHETGSLIVNAFIDTYPGIKQHEWDARYALSRSPLALSGTQR